LIFYTDLDVDHGAVVARLRPVELAHADLSEVTRVELVEERSHVVLAAGITAAAGVLAVLADAAVARRHGAALLAVLA